ncbi:MAG: phosphopantetheine-binding protein [Pseudomonadota bacterium]
MKSQTEILAAVQKSIATVLNRDVSEIGVDANLVDDLGAESIDFLDISSELEKMINVEINFNDIAGGKSSNLTVMRIVDHIAALS